MTDLFCIGIDVQMRRPLPYAVLDNHGTLSSSGWLKNSTALEELATLITSRGPDHTVVAIDAPRMPLAELRTRSFRRGKWCLVNGVRGRHCEVAIRAMALANPQWTPLTGDAPPWMKLGFRLFEAASEAGAKTLEVFPSASYRCLDLAGDVATVPIPIGMLKPGPKDMLDAVVGAFTALRFMQSKGSEVGGGDGLGTIVLPTEIPDHPVGRWPDGV